MDASMGWKSDSIRPYGRRRTVRMTAWKTGLPETRARARIATVIIEFVGEG